MLTIIDRYMLRALLINYLIALAVMICLYAALDMFVNMDEFTEQGYPLPIVVKNIISYYWPNVFLYFKELSSVIALFACMATIARMRRLNELTVALASGVSLYRLAAPVIGFGLATTALLVIDTELIIPRVAHLLARDRDDADGALACEISFLRDRDGALLSAGKFHPRTGDLQWLRVLTRDENGSVRQMLEADHAVWEPPSLTRPQGGWRLERGLLRTRARDTEAGIGPRGDLKVEPCYFYESDLSPEAIQLRQAEGWISYLSLAQLRDLEESGAPSVATIAATRHARIASPLVGMVMLLLGLPFFLDRWPGNVLGDAGKCMIACGLCYVAGFVSQSIRPQSASALYAWMPIFIFATIAIVRIDRIRT